MLEVTMTVQSQRKNLETQYSPKSGIKITSTIKTLIGKLCTRCYNTKSNKLEKQLKTAICWQPS